MKFRNILLFSDMDGTLVSSDGKISEENIRAVNYFMSEGGRFAVATGRGVWNMGDFFKSIKPNMPVICLNGSEIYNPENGEVIYETNIDSSVRQAAKLALEKIPHIGIVVKALKDAYILNDAPGARHYAKRCQKPFEMCLLGDIKENLVILGIWGENKKDTEDIVEFVKGNQFASEGRWVRVDECVYEYVPKAADKGLALLERKKEYSNCIIVAVGDNDILMLKNADVGFAVKNATIETKNSADYVLESSNNENPIAEAIKIIEERGIWKLLQK